MEGGHCLEIKKRWIGEPELSYLSGAGGEIPATGCGNLSHFGRVFGELYGLP
jgi:hypothetical protein